MKSHQQAPTTDILQKARLQEILNSLASLPSFDCLNYKTAKAYEKNISVIMQAFQELSAFIHADNELLDNNEKLKIAAYYLQIGAYHVHIKKDLDAALNFLMQAKTIFAELKISRHDYLGWINNHLACVELENFVKNRQKKEFAERALKYCGDIINEYQVPHNRQEELKIQAFAFVVEARARYALGDSRLAKYNYLLAMNLYEAGGFEIKYADAKKNYVCILAEINDPTAEKLFQDLDDSWVNHLDSDAESEENIENYCFEMAGFMDSYGDYLLNHKADSANAREKFEGALYILGRLDVFDTQQARDIQVKLTHMGAEVEAEAASDNTAESVPRGYSAFLGLFAGRQGQVVPDDLTAAPVFHY